MLGTSFPLVCETDDGLLELGFKGTHYVLITEVSQ